MIAADLDTITLSIPYAQPIKFEQDGKGICMIWASEKDIYPGMLALFATKLDLEIEQGITNKCSGPG